MKVSSSRWQMSNECARCDHHADRDGRLVESDAHGRELQLKRFGPWLISYWPDHAAKELRIVRIESV